jgi:hypothetical protein
LPTTIPIACSLEAAERPQREASLKGLGRTLAAVEAEGLEARLAFPSIRRADLEAFVEAESGCCPFFDFAITDEDERVHLEVRAPEGGEWAVRGLVAGFISGWGELL